MFEHIDGPVGEMAIEKGTVDTLIGEHRRIVDRAHQPVAGGKLCFASL